MPKLTLALDARLIETRAKCRPIAGVLQMADAEMILSQAATPTCWSRHGPPAKIRFGPLETISSMKEMLCVFAARSISNG